VRFNADLFAAARTPWSKGTHADWLEAVHWRPIDVHSPAAPWYSLPQSRRTGPPLMRFGRRVDADIRIYVQEVRAVHTAATDGGVRAALRLPGMQRAFSPCPPDRAKLPHHVGRRPSGRRKIRARHRRIARRWKIARSRMQLLRKSGFQDGETRQGETVSAGLTDLASRDPADIPQASKLCREVSTSDRPERCPATRHGPSGIA
jgi:hypothetical protein